MRAVRIRDGAPERVDVDEPEGDGVVVSVASTGICGTDLHLLGYGLTSTPGHEIAGTLDDGSVVGLQPNLPCGSCARCAAGQDQLCAAGVRHLLGVTADGGMAERVLADPRCIVAVHGVAADDAVVLEPLAVGLHAVNQVELHAGQRVLVVGAGTIGLMTIAVLRARGIDVDIAARHDWQRAAAEALGATVPADDAPAPYDVVFDAAGSQSSLDLAVERVEVRGSIVVVGTYWSPVQLGLALLSKEARIVPAVMYGHHHGRREFDAAAELLATLPSLADVVVTHRFPLEDVAEAFRVAGDRSTRAIKVVVSP